MAIAQSEEIIPVHCFDDAHFDRRNGFKKKLSCSIF
jgi:hypothetical protein